MRIPRRQFLSFAAVAAGFAIVARCAQAQAYPARPVRIIMGFASGASGDVAARILAPALGRLLGQQFVVENRTGAGSNIATNFVAHAPKDGYTLLQGTAANTINAAITISRSSSRTTLPRSHCLRRCRIFWWCIPRSACTA